MFTVLVQLGEVVGGLAAGSMVRKSQEKRLEESQPNSLWRGGSGRGVAELSGNSACLTIL